MKLIIKKWLDIIWIVMYNRKVKEEPKMKKFGTVIVDGKIIDLDKIPLDELDEVVSKLEKEEKQIIE